MSIRIEVPYLPQRRVPLRFFMAQANQGDYGRPSRRRRRIALNSKRIIKILTDVSPVGD